MTKNPVSRFLLFLSVLLAIAFQLLYFTKIRLLPVNDNIVQLLAGVFTGAAVGTVSVLQYQNGKHRSALGIALLAIGVMLVLIDIKNIFAELSVAFVLASVFVFYEGDQIILSRIS